MNEEKIIQLSWPANIVCNKQMVKTFNKTFYWQDSKKQYWDGFSYYLISTKKEV